MSSFRQLPRKICVICTYEPRQNKATEDDYKGPLTHAVNALVVNSTINTIEMYVDPTNPPTEVNIKGHSIAHVIKNIVHEDEYILIQKLVRDNNTKKL